MCRLAKDSRQRIRAGPLGLGLLVGLAVLSYGLERGCTTAEILAINDEGSLLNICHLQMRFEEVGKKGNKKRKGVWRASARASSLLIL